MFPASLRGLYLRGLHLLFVERVRILVALFTILLVVERLLGFRPDGLFNDSVLHLSLGAGFVLAGLLLRSWAAGTLVKHHQLTTVGPYACVRHPLYLGSLLLTTGFVILLGSWPTWLSLIPFIGLHALAISREERWLGRHYGEAWDEYAARTPALFPWIGSEIASGWSFQQWRKNHEYHAWLGAAAGMALIELASRW